MGRINNRINQAKVYTKTNKNNTGVHMSTKLEKKLIYYHQKNERTNERKKERIREKKTKTHLLQVKEKRKSTKKQTNPFPPIIYYYYKLMWVWHARAIMKYASTLFSSAVCYWRTQ